MPYMFLQTYSRMASYTKNPILTAIQSGDREGAKSRIASASREELDRGFPAPIFAAAERGYLDVVKALVEKGASIQTNKRGYVVASKGFTPFAVAKFHMSITPPGSAGHANYKAIVEYLEEQIKKIEGEEKPVIEKNSTFRRVPYDVWYMTEMMHGTAANVEYDKEGRGFGGRRRSARSRTSRRRTSRRRRSTRSRSTRRN